MNPLVKRPAPVLRWRALRRGSGRRAFSSRRSLRGRLGPRTAGKDFTFADCLPATVGW